ncbi:hypothetical protein BX600DRAFT_443802 [Xylariales sp. PMI_506]|nr:hypothetical protein BX600DRAFT_443802 [Xylariales sp. PMI_506]
MLRQALILSAIALAGATTNIEPLEMGFSPAGVENMDAVITRAIELTYYPIQLIIESPDGTYYNEACASTNEPAVIQEIISILEIDPECTTYQVSAAVAPIIECHSDDATETAVLLSWIEFCAQTPEFDPEEYGFTMDE